MKIALIDSGIDAMFPQYETNVKFQCYIRENGPEFTNCAKDENGHGTSCADIILRYCPSAQLYVYKIYEDSLVTEPERLLWALKVCQRTGVDIINLSLGMLSKVHYEELLNICKQLIDDGVIIVASGSESDALVCWPAEFPFVLKVNSVEDCPKTGYYFYEQESLTVGTYGGKEFAKGLEGQKTIIWGNSFACARVTGILAKQIEERESNLLPQDLYHFLMVHAIEVRKLENNVNFLQNVLQKPLKDKKAILFPFNKEMHSLVRFADILDYQIAAVADFPFSRQAKKDVGTCIGLKEYGVTIETSYERVLQTNADIVVLGELSEVSRIYKKDYFEQYVLKAFEAQKDVITIELIREEVYQKIKNAAKDKGKSFIALNDYLVPRSYNRVPNIEFKAPVLCVLGTRPKAGKFSFQVYLREYLQIIGYEVCTVSTEPQGFLFGYRTVPLGNAVLLDYVSFEEQIEYLRGQIAKAQQESNCDILLLGGQSGVVPYNIDILTDYNSLSSIITILAGKPDGFVLCISPTDEIEYIKRTIRAIEAFGYGKVFLCIMTNRKVDTESRKGILYEKISYLSIDEHKKVCDSFSDLLGLPVKGFLTKEDIKQVIIIIQNYFCEED